METFQGGHEDQVWAMACATIAAGMMSRAHVSMVPATVASQAALAADQVLVEYRKRVALTMATRKL